MSHSTQPGIPNTDDHPNGTWLGDTKRPIIGAPVPLRYLSMPATVDMFPNGWIPATAPGSHPAFIDPATVHQNMVGHFGMVHHHHHQPGWSQYAPCIITPPVTPPNHPRAVYDANGRNRGLPQPQVQAHHAHVAHWPQTQQQHIVYLDPNHSSHAYLRAQQQTQQQLQQSEKALLAQFYAKLSMEDTDKKPSATATAPVTITAAEIPAQQTPAVAETISTGSTELTIVPGGAAGATRTILGPNGNALVPPPDPAHPGCELSEPMAKALENFEIPHCCDYMEAKDLLRDKIVNQVLENTKEKLMELLQNELDRMASEEDDSEFDCNDEDKDEELGQEWTRLEG